MYNHVFAKLLYLPVMNVDFCKKKRQRFAALCKVFPYPIRTSHISRAKIAKQAIKINRDRHREKERKKENKKRKKKVIEPRLERKKE